MSYRAKKGMGRQAGRWSQGVTGPVGVQYRAREGQLMGPGVAQGELISAGDLGGQAWALLWAGLSSPLLGSPGLPPLREGLVWVSNTAQGPREVGSIGTSAWVVVLACPGAAGMSCVATQC